MVGCYRRDDTLYTLKVIHYYLLITFVKHCLILIEFCLTFGKYILIYYFHLCLSSKYLKNTY